MISFEEFSRLARDANVIPLVQPMLADLHTPVSTYLTLREGSKASFLFESAEPNEKVGRHSFVGIDPVMIVRARGAAVEVSGDTLPGVRNIFEAAGAIMGRYRFPSDSGVHGFAGGLVGFIGYNNVSHLENLPLPAPRPGEEDDAVLGLFTTIVRFDHREQAITMIHSVVIDPSRSLREQYEIGRKVLEAVELRLRRSAVVAQSFSASGMPDSDTADRERFCAAVVRAKEYIVEGDIFQVVLSRRTQLSFVGDPFPVYRALRVINPSPYLFFLDFHHTRLIGSSPEVLMRVHDRMVEVFPIAGTRRRGADENEDRALEQELLADEKELAEHIMLVDLGRNDVGRVSDHGSVDVPALKRVERYSHVMHIVSEVRGRLRGDLTPVDALKACFPAGTVSGAPKVRAMEIIGELEPVRRGAYAGAVGYIGFNGELDTCIAIRTIICCGDRLSVQAGAGIVADSDPLTEYHETLNKSRALLDAIGAAANGLGSIPNLQHPARRA